MAKKRTVSVPLSKISQEDKKFFRQLLDILKLYHCQREALFQILRELEIKNWEPIYRVLQGEREIVQKADQVFAFAYASIESGNRDSAALGQLSKDPLNKWKPN